MNNHAKEYDHAIDTKSTKFLVHRSVIYDHDLSYKRLLGLTQWQRLKPEIRRRFSIRPSANRQITYKGTMAIVYLSFMGRLFAQCCRMIGRPIATRVGKDVPVEVILSGRRVDAAATGPLLADLSAASRVSETVSVPGRPSRTSKARIAARVLVPRMPSTGPGLYPREASWR